MKVLIINSIIPLRNIKIKSKSKNEISNQLKNIIYNNESDLFSDYEYINKLLKYNRYKKINYF